MSDAASTTSPSCANESCTSRYAFEGGAAPAVGEEGLGRFRSWSGLDAARGRLLDWADIDAIEERQSEEHSVQHMLVPSSWRTAVDAERDE